MNATATARATALKTLIANPAPALFVGPAGSGKAQAAQEVAAALGADVRRIDLSQVVSRYIGETEKNLDRAFADAQRDGAVLIFDEADALFGKRTEVKDAHDRYANIEANYLLTKIEAYRGAVILTTNHRDAIDPAFLRRLRTVIDFHPPPEAGA